MTIRAVLFDFGGVLVRTEDLSGRRKWEAHLGLPDWGLAEIVFDSQVSARAQLGQLPTTAIWRHVAEVCRLSAGQLEELQQDFWSGDRLDGKLVQFLCGLRPRCRTAILSNAWPDAREVFVEKFGLGDVVDAMVISAEEGVMKPDCRIYEIALRRLGVRPGEAVFVDDMAGNVAGARAAGLRAVQFERTDQTIAEVRNLLDL